MKKTLLIIMVLAMVLGLTQCKKPVIPGGDQPGEVQYVTFAVNSSDDRGEFVEADGTSSTRILKYKWKSGDKLYAYGVQNGDFSSSNGQFLGKLTTSENDVYSATFYGSLTIPSGYNSDSKIRFFHYGSAADVNTTTGVATVSLQAQDGTIGNTSAKTVAMCQCAYSSNNFYRSELEVQFAVAKFDLRQFNSSGTGIVVTMTSNTGGTIEVSERGNLTYQGAGSTNTCTLAGVTSSSKQYYVVIAPGNATLEFTYGSKTASGTKTFAKDKFYYKSANEGIVINIPKPLFIDGVFTVNASGKQVQFSRGNLYNIGGGSGTFGFLEKQWNFYTYPGGPCCIDNTYYSSGCPGRGLFAWCTGTNNSWGTTVDGGAHYDEEFKDYGGNVTGVGSEWFTMTKDEWDYVMEGRANSANLRRWLSFDASTPIINGVYDMDYGFNVGARICGIVILPDGTENTSTIWKDLTVPSKLEKYNAVFLPSSGSSYSQYSVTSIGGGGDVQSDDKPTAFYWASSKSLYWDNNTGKYRYLGDQYAIDRGSVNWPNPVWFNGHSSGGACSSGAGRAYRLVREVPSSKEE